MISIKVCRDPAFPDGCQSDDEFLNWGADVSDALLSTQVAALERGRIEIDRQYSNRKSANLVLHQRTFIQPGTTIATANVDKIEIGRMEQISITVQKSGDEISAGSEITMEKNI